jgi:hypothetical protein
MPLHRRGMNRISLCLCLFSAMRGAALAEPPAPVVEILSPSEGAAVTTVGELDGRLHGKGFPVVLVRPLPDQGQQPWYVQPWIESLDDGKFSAQVFFGDANTPSGTQFRVVALVERSREDAERHFKPGTKLENLPPELARSAFLTVLRRAVARPPSKFAPQDRFISFAGRAWAVKCGEKLGPGPNWFSDSEEQVRVEKDGRLRLAVTERDGHWHCAEVVGSPLGYGEYRWVVSGDLATLDPNVVLGLFVYADPGRDHRAREIDFELSRWSDAGKSNAQFVIQPYVFKEMRRFDTGKAEVLVISLTWNRGAVGGRCWAGDDASHKPLAEWKYVGAKIPRPEEVRVRMNLWLFNGHPPVGKRPQEIVIRSFRFEPAERETSH